MERGKKKKKKAGFITLFFDLSCPGAFRSGVECWEKRICFYIAAIPVQLQCHQAYLANQKHGCSCNCDETDLDRDRELG